LRGAFAVHSGRVTAIPCRRQLQDEQAHADFLCSSLEDLYPYHALVNLGGCIKFHNGLLLLSKHPIKNTILQPYDRVERHMATKSNLIVDIQVGHNGTTQIWRLVNLHTTAGGTVDPRIHRLIQIEKMN
jgi:hypothetical protein